MDKTINLNEPMTMLDLLSNHATVSPILGMIQTGFDNHNRALFGKTKTKRDIVKVVFVRHG